MKRFILTTTMALGILMSGTANVGYTKGNCFNDVTKDTSYYEDIKRLYNMGVLNGYDDGNFYPDNKISVADGMALAERVFGGTDSIYIDKYLFWGDYAENMSYETAAELLLKANDLQPIHAAMWNHRSTSFNWYINTLYIRGYAGMNVTVPYSMATVTRSEFCHMLSFILDYDGTYTAPPMNDPIIIPEVYMPEKFDDANALVLNTQSFLSCVPKTIREAFVNNGYEVIIVPNDELDKLVVTEENTIGIYMHNEKKIYIKSGYLDKVVHEFGHYVHFALQEQGYDISTDNDFKKQLAIFKHGNDNYYLTNDDEFFAESFKLYCENYEGLKLNAPEVFEYMDSAVKAFAVQYERMWLNWTD